ncbi:uncharacterized protein SOCE836_100500 [Sorangium cellulosum]|uniref:Uncharacterized protein n=1 Tax=Sorangium cellulosum TaxID=56 RepID=A0A4P2R413_SORCE|nr:uncharacterized protein SOCE836_100500 [Sorangium cellulosum]WCQ97106.1 hypothetical protein NQZ70_09897 [Sorangium sp. Soce836]
MLIRVDYPTRMRLRSFARSSSDTPRNMSSTAANDSLTKKLGLDPIAPCAASANLSTPGLSFVATANESARRIACEYSSGNPSLASSMVAARDLPDLTPSLVELPSGVTICCPSGWPARSSSASRTVTSRRPRAQAATWALIFLPRRRRRAYGTAISGNQFASNFRGPAWPLTTGRSLPRLLRQDPLHRHRRSPRWSHLGPSDGPGSALPKPRSLQRGAAAGNRSINRSGPTPFPSSAHSPGAWTAVDGKAQHQEHRAS